MGYRRVSFTEQPAPSRFRTAVLFLHILHRPQIAFESQTDIVRFARHARVGDPAERFALSHVADMDLGSRKADRFQGIQVCIFFSP